MNTKRDIAIIITGSLVLGLVALALVILNEGVSP